MVRRGLLLGALAVGLLAGATPQPRAAAKLLIATASSHDPELAQTVILLLRSGADGDTGLVLNQETDVTVFEIFQGLTASAKRLHVYKGGPVRMGINGLVRRKTKLAGFSPVVGDVYLISDEAVLKRSIAASSAAQPIRVYVGLCGWTAGQLADEMRRGVWTMGPARPEILFDRQPKTLWQRLSTGLGR